MIAVLRHENKSINSFIASRLKLYPSFASTVLYSAINNVWAGSQAIPSFVYYQNEERIIKYIRDELDKWFREFIPVAEDFGKNSYKKIRELSVTAFEQLGEIEYKTVPDDKLPTPLGSDTIDLGTGDLVQKKEQEEEQIPIIKLIVGEGGLDAEYERLLRAQFDAKVDPRNAIVTFSAETVAKIESELIRGLRDGVDNAVVRDRLVKQLVGDIASPDMRKLISGRVHTILRTTIQNASISSAFMFARMNPMVVGLVRQTGPRPCIACISLAGTVYKTYNEFRDHPNGMCFVTYELLPADKLGVDVSKLPLSYRNAWKRNLGEIPLRKLQFEGLSESEQKAIFANNALFHLWKEEKFPLEALAVKRGGAYAQASYSETLAKVKDLGGITYPKIGFPSQIVKDKWNLILDPHDRANAALYLFVVRPAITSVNQYGLSIYPKELTAEILKDVDPDLRAPLGRIPGNLDDIENAPYYIYNTVARILKVNIRKATNGDIYYVG